MSKFVETLCKCVLYEGECIAFSNIILETQMYYIGLKFCYQCSFFAFFCERKEDFIIHIVFIIYTLLFDRNVFAHIMNENGVFWESYLVQLLLLLFLCCAQRKIYEICNAECVVRNGDVLVDYHVLIV